MSEILAQYGKDYLASVEGGTPLAPLGPRLCPVPLRLVAADDQSPNQALDSVEAHYQQTRGQFDVLTRDVFSILVRLGQSARPPQTMEAASINLVQLQHADAKGRRYLQAVPIVSRSTISASILVRAISPSVAASKQLEYLSLKRPKRQVTDRITMEQNYVRNQEFAAMIAAVLALSELDFR